MSFGPHSRRIPGTTVPLQARHAVIAAAGVVVLLIVGWYLAFHVVGVADADTRAYFAFLHLTQDHTGLRDLAQAITWLCSPGVYVVLAAVPVLMALARRRWALALAIAVMIPAAILSAETLKGLLAAPRPDYGAGGRTFVSLGSWPSGHSTASMALGLALIIASPARWRAWAAVIGTTFALAVAYSVLSLGWHYPSDALGGILLALTWTLLAVAAVLAVDTRFGRDLEHLDIETTGMFTHMPNLRMVFAAAALPFLAVMIWRGSQVVSLAAGHLAFVAAACAVAILGVLAPTVLSVVLSGSDPAPTAARSRRLPPG